MNTGQTLLTLGALILLSFTIMNVNKILNENDELLNKTRFGLEVVALATSIIEEASQLPFDEVSWDSTKIDKKPSDFTLFTSLGPDFGETDYASFDDFDDFHNYTIAETTLQNIYNISCNVGYVTLSNPDSIVNPRSLYKNLTVTVTSPSCDDTVRMSYIHGYWYFN